MQEEGRVSDGSLLEHLQFGLGVLRLLRAVVRHLVAGDFGGRLAPFQCCWRLPTLACTLLLLLVNGVERDVPRAE